MLGSAHQVRLAVVAVAARHRLAWAWLFRLRNATHSKYKASSTFTNRQTYYVENLCRKNDLCLDGSMWFDLSKTNILSFLTSFINNILLTLFVLLQYCILYNSCHKRPLESDGGCMEMKAHLLSVSSSNEPNSILPGHMECVLNKSFS